MHVIFILMSWTGTSDGDPITTATRQCDNGMSWTVCLVCAIERCFDHKTILKKKNILISSQSLTHLSRMCDYVIFLGREVCSMSNNARIVHSISSTCGWIRTTWKHRPMPNKNCVMGSQTSSSSSFRTVIAHTSFIIAQSSSAIKPFPYQPHVYTYTAP